MATMFDNDVAEALYKKLTIAVKEANRESIYKKLNFTKREQLKPYWEGYYLLEYGNTTVENLTKGSELSKFRDFIQKLPSEKTIGPTRLKRLFKDLAELQNTTPLDCFCEYLNFCISNKLPFNGMFVDESIFVDKNHPEAQHRWNYITDEIKKLREREEEQKLANRPNPTESIAAHNQNQIPQPKPENARENVDTKYHYASSDRLAVIGRDKQQEELGEFLASKEKFLWLQLAGVAGQGKSRLAHELILKAQRENWQAGFLTKKAFNQFKNHWQDWRPDQNYLLVIDYVIGNEEHIRHCLQALLLNNYQEFQYSVRVLLVERQPWNKGGLKRPATRIKKSPQKSDNTAHNKLEIHQSIENNTSSIDQFDSDPYAQWYLQLCTPLNEFENDLDEKDIKYYLKNTKFDDGLIELKKLNEDDLVSLTQQTAEKVAKKENTKTSLSSEKIKEQLQHLDKSGRPLYAYFLGEAYGYNQNLNLLTLEELLNTTLERHIKARWASGVDANRQQNNNHNQQTEVLKLAVLATITKGFDYKQNKDNNLIIAPFVIEANPEQLESAMRLTDSPIRATEFVGPGNIILPLEPDILGEWFVLTYLNEALNLQEIINNAWQYNPKDTAAFYQRISQDFPTHPVSQDLFANNFLSEDAFTALSKEASSILYYLWIHDNNTDFPELIIKALMLAANNNDAAAMQNLGFCFDNGKGVKQDYQQANDWYLKAVELGNSDAMVNLGLNYENGRGVNQDYQQANDWYLKAAELGNSHAMRFLGVNYQNGHGVNQDYQQANDWYLKAAELGNSDAMRFLGLNYENGQGVDQDHEQAYYWYQKALDNGNKAAKKHLIRLQPVLLIIRDLGNNNDLLDFKEFTETPHDWIETQLSNEPSTWAEAPPLWSEQKWTNVTGSWYKNLIGSLAVQLLEQNHVEDIYQLQCENIRSIPLSFSPGIYLVDFQINNKKLKEIQFISALATTNNIVLLDGISTNIDALNKKLISLQKTSEVAAYLQFFCNYVRGEEGPFSIVESIDQIPFTKTDPSNTTQEQLHYNLASKICPISFTDEAQPNKGSFMIEANVLYGQSLFQSKFEIENSGNISILDVDVIKEDLPVMRRTYKGIFRSMLLAQKF